MTTGRENTPQDPGRRQDAASLESPHPHSAGERLADFSIRYPVTICMLFVSLITFGLIATTKIPLVLFPDATFPFLAIYVNYPNATPNQILESITKPIEEAVATLPGVQRLEAEASRDSTSVRVHFNWGHDTDVARAEIREKLDQIRGELPEDVRHIFIQNFSSTDRPVLIGQIASGRDLRTEYELLDLKIKQPLERLPGVGEVMIWGADRPEIDIYLRLDDLKRYRVNVERLFRALDEVNRDRSLGRVVSGGVRYGAVAAGTIESQEELENFPINDRGITLGQVADIEFGNVVVNQGRHLDGKYSVGFAIRKTSQANTVQVVERVLAEIEEINRDPSLEGVRLLIWRNAAEEITKSLEGLLNAGVYGAVLAVVVLMFFVRRLALTLVIGLAIPFSIVGAVGLLYAAGNSLNVLSMMGLMLSTGMLVDNAVVVLESIYQQLEKGRDRVEAARIGTRGVYLAVLAATLTSIIIFVPLIFGKQSQFSSFLSHAGVSIIFALLCSLFISLTLIPLAMARLLSVDLNKEGKWQQVVTDHLRPAIIWLGRRIFGRRAADWGAPAPPGRGPITQAYLRLVDWPLQHRFLCGLVLTPLLVGVSAYVLNQKVPDNTPEAQELEELDIDFEFSENYHYAKIERDYVRPVEQFLMDNEERFKIEHITSEYRNNAAEVEVFFNTGQVTARQMLDIRRQISEELPVIPGANIKLGHQEGAQAENWFSANIYGDDPRTITRLAEKAKERLETYPGFAQVHTPIKDAREEVQVRINRALARRYGLSPRVIAQILGIVVRGQRVRGYRTPQGEMDIVVQIHPKDLGSLEDLKSVVVGRSPEGEDILLGQVARFEIEKVPGRIERHNRRTSQDVRAVYAGAQRAEGMRILREVMDSLDYPFGYGWSFGFWTQRQQQQDRDFFFNIILALFMVYFVMASLFESLTHPFAIMFSLPFAVVGVAWFLLLTNTPFNMIARIGLMVLIGIVVNNGIVLIDHINNLRRAGMRRADAIREGCRERLRPIVMTATTTIVGLIPLAIGDNSLLNMRYFPMARTVMGGLMASTVLTLIVLPTYYSLFDDLGAWVRRVWAMSAPRERGEPAGSPAAGD